MITPVSFTGKAYFFDNALKTMSADQKRRIENYAKKCDENTNVVVIGSKKEPMYEYNGVTYENESVTYNTSEHKYRIDTGKGLKTVTSEQVKISQVSIPVYNAYIVYDFNMDNVRLPHYMKEFDFRPGAKSTIIGCNYKEHSDMSY